MHCYPSFAWVLGTHMKVLVVSQEDFGQGGAEATEFTFQPSIQFSIVSQHIAQQSACCEPLLELTHYQKWTRGLQPTTHSVS